MIENLIRNFQQFGSLTQEEILSIEASSELRSFKKGDFLLKEGQSSELSYFVLEGCIRQYNLSDGDEKTTRFFTENDWVISVGGAPENPPSMHNWICMENCTLVVGNEEKAQLLFAQHPRLEGISRKIVETAFSDIQRSIVSYYSESPEQRYLSLIRHHPQLIHRVPQYHIASYIGVKPESLSRIRRRIVRQQD